MSAWASHPRDEETGRTRESSVASNTSDWAEEPEITVEEPSYDPATTGIKLLPRYNNFSTRSHAGVYWFVDLRLSD
jgi:hypothetical protein